MTNSEATKKVLSLIPNDFGKPFDELKKDILKTVQHGSSDRFYSKVNGYSVFYTANDNYMQGVRNGGGRGYYASLQYVGMTKTIKLDI